MIGLSPCAATPDARSRATIAAASTVLPTPVSVPVMKQPRKDCVVRLGGPRREPAARAAGGLARQCRARAIRLRGRLVIERTRGLAVPSRGDAGAADLEVEHPSVGCQLGHRSADRDLLALFQVVVLGGVKRWRRPGRWLK